MAMITSAVTKQDLLTEISQRRVRDAKATYDTEVTNQELVENARSLLVSIVSLVKSNMTTYDICTSRVRNKYNSKAWLTDFRDKLSLGVELIGRYELLGKIGDGVYIKQLDPTYNRSNYKNHENNKLLQALYYLQDIGFVKVNHTDHSIDNYNLRSTTWIPVPYSVTPTKEGKAYVATLSQIRALN